MTQALVIGSLSGQSSSLQVGYSWSIAAYNYTIVMMSNNIQMTNNETTKEHAIEWLAHYIMNITKFHGKMTGTHSQLYLEQI